MPGIMPIRPRNTASIHTHIMRIDLVLDKGCWIFSVWQKLIRLLCFWLVCLDQEYGRKEKEQNVANSSWDLHRRRILSIVECTPMDISGGINCFALRLAGISESRCVVKDGCTPFFCFLCAWWNDSDASWWSQISPKSDGHRISMSEGLGHSPIFNRENLSLMQRTMNQQRFRSNRLAIESRQQNVSNTNKLFQYKPS